MPKLKKKAPPARPVDGMTVYGGWASSCKLGSEGAVVTYLRHTVAAERVQGKHPNFVRMWAQTIGNLQPSAAIAKVSEAGASDDCCP